MDKIDIKLLKVLQRDAGLSVGVLAERVGLSKSACWRRLQKLEEAEVISGRVTLLNPEALGLKLTVFISIRTNAHNKVWSEQFRRVVLGLPGVLEVYRMGGDIDYLIKAVVEDMVGYDALYQRLIEADLFEVSASFVMETIKHTTELPL
ncbi:MAG: transcriptional regulator [Gammaproteobacteria bacterium]|nr:MAG: transcriptional regulator [Gammaproteobacteria bacterium]